MIFRLKYSREGVWGIFRFTSKMSECWVCKMVSLNQTSENVCLLMYQLIRLWSTTYAATVHLGRRKMFQSWYIRFFAIQRSENVWLHVFKLTLYCRSMMVQYKLSHIGKCLRSDASCSSDRKRCVLSSVYSCLSYPLVSVGSSAAESMSIVFHLGRMENDVNLYSLPNLFWLCFIYCYISSYFSLIEIFRIRLEQNGFWIENIGTDFFRCGLDWGQSKSV